MIGAHSVSPFQEIFVVQILGGLLARTYTGMISFRFEDNLPTAVWLDGAGGVRVLHQERSDAAWLQAILWRSQGRVKLHPQIPAPKTDLLHYSDEIERAIQTAMPALPESCPLLKSASLQRGLVLPPASGTLAEAGARLLRRLDHGSQALAPFQGVKGEAAFWPAFLYLCGSGQLVVRYDQTLGQMLAAFEADLRSRLGKLFGPKVVAPFLEDTHNSLRVTWPDWGKTPPDAIHGAAPYIRWANKLKENMISVGMPTLVHRAFTQAINRLPPAEGERMRALVEYPS